MQIEFSQTDFIELTKAVNDLLDYDESDLENDMRNTPRIFAKLQRLHFAEATKYDELVGKRSEMELYYNKFYDGRLPEAAYKAAGYSLNVKIQKADIPKHIKGNPHVIELAKFIKAQERIVSFLEESVKLCKVRDYNIKTILDFRKWEAA